MTKFTPADLAPSEAITKSAPTAEAIALCDAVDKVDRMFRDQERTSDILAALAQATDLAEQVRAQTSSAEGDAA